eukprot:sb/3476926/
MGVKLMTTLQDEFPDEFLGMSVGSPDKIRVCLFVIAAFWRMTCPKVVEAAPKTLIRRPSTSTRVVAARLPLVVQLKYLVSHERTSFNTSDLGFTQRTRYIWDFPSEKDKPNT